MSDYKVNGSKLYGVGCDAVNCQYQCDGCCHASSIAVESPSAQKKADTFCSTFRAKTE